VGKTKPEHTRTAEFKTIVKPYEEIIEFVESQVKNIFSQFKRYFKLLI